MRALLCLAMIVGLSAILAIALMRVACFATEECFLFMHTRRRRRGRLVPIKLILVKGTVWASPHHALESRSTQLRPTRRKQSFPGERSRIEKCWHRGDRRTGSLAPP